MSLLAKYESDIGFPSGLNDTAQTKSLIALLELNPRGVVALTVRLWLGKQGLPSQAVNTALPNSLALAYCSPGYLRSWRNRVNPNWSLLGSDIEDDETATLTAPPSATQTAPPAVPTATGSEIRPSEEWLRLLYAQVEKTVTKLVGEAKIQLDPEAKAQIRALATAEGREAAARWTEANSPPREILITNSAEGVSRNIGLQHEKFPHLLRAASARDHRGYRLNIWLTGPTGSGKTTAAENVAKALNIAFGCDGSLDADYKVLGFRNAQGEVVSTQFLSIYANGGIYVADEIDNWLPSALLSLNAALANGFVASPSGLIRRHPDACVIACANTWGLGATNDYVGRTKLDAASLDRFHPKIDWPVDAKLERAIAENAAGKLGTEWHNVILAARAKTLAQGLKIIISPRSTFAGLSLLQADFPPRDVVDMTFGAGLTPDQRRTLASAIDVGPIETVLSAARTGRKAPQGAPTDDSDEPLLTDFPAFAEEDIL